VPEQESAKRSEDGVRHRGPACGSRYRVGHSAIVEIARHVYASIGPAFDGPGTNIAPLELIAPLRVKPAGALKNMRRPELGRLLGLDRAPW
jgi:hypothetical protein